MSDYQAPLDDMNFVLNELADFSSLTEFPQYENATPDMVPAILGEAAKLAQDVIAPLNRSGDRIGLKLDAEGNVQTPPGFREAYSHYVTGGWGGLQFDPEYGGHGLPFSLTIPVQEMWHSANMAWGLCPLLSQGAVEAIAANADDILKDRYLAKMISGEWSGTMNLTEPQAGSDLALIRTAAVPDPAGHYRLTGQKIFITWGEHDMADNIVHLVLARLPDAPPGVRGISLFLVPKLLVEDDGTLGQRNDCRAVSLEHKMGIHASPTCVMSYGDNGGAIGYLVGEENRGLACMFTMMNNARLTVGLQGVAIAERAYQQARAYCRDRVQGVAPGAGETGPIIRHPDVRRMLLTMKSLTEAGRALAYVACREVDLSKADLPDEQKLYRKRRLDLLTPLVKGWCTEIAQEVTSLNVQCHGGMGFIEETGAAQHFRDARILPIYEGTNGIQAMDLVGRKVLSDNGRAMFELLEELEGFAAGLSVGQHLSEAQLNRFSASLSALRTATEQLLNTDNDPMLAGAIAFNYLMLASTVTAAALMLKASAAASGHQATGNATVGFYDAKVLTVRFFLDHILPRYLGYAAAIESGSDSVMALPEDLF